MLDSLTISHYFFLGIWIITIIFRLSELRIAKQNLQKRKSEPNLQIAKEPFFFLFVILHSSFLVAVPIEVLLLKTGFKFEQGAICLIIYLLCLVMRVSVLTTLKQNWNVKVVYDPKSKESIATTGLYQYIRHPNYLIVILEIASISLFHGAILSFLFFSICNLCILFFRIRQEENALMQNPFYKEHFSNKKRFIPYLF